MTAWDNEYNNDNGNKKTTTGELYESRLLRQHFLKMQQSQLTATLKEVYPFMKNAWHKVRKSFIERWRLKQSKYTCQGKRRNRQVMIDV